MGETKLSRKEIVSVIDKLREEFVGKSYNLTSRNCNHFSDRLVKELVGKGIPGWVNRAAGVGGVFSSVMDFFKMKPASMGSMSSGGGSAGGNVGSSGTALNGGKGGEGKGFVAFQGKGTTLG